MSEWMRCEDGLPKHGQVVLVTNDKGHVSFGKYRGVESDGNGPCYWRWKNTTLMQVIAWMPLPEPYKEGE